MTWHLLFINNQLQRDFLSFRSSRSYIPHTKFSTGNKDFIQFTTDPLFHSPLTLPSNLFGLSEPLGLAGKYFNKLLSRTCWLLSRSKGSPCRQNERHSSLIHKFRSPSIIYHWYESLHNLKQRKCIVSMTTKQTDIFNTKLWSTVYMCYASNL